LLHFLEEKKDGSGFFTYTKAMQTSEQRKQHNNMQVVGFRLQLHSYFPSTIDPQSKPSRAASSTTRKRTILLKT
jgi:hypothetical protein